MVDGEGSQDLIRGNSLNKFFEVLAIIKGYLEKDERLNNRGSFAKVHKPLDGLLEHAAFLESQVDDAIVLGSLDGKQDILHLPLVERLHFDGYALVERSFNGDCFMMLQVFVSHEVNKQFLS